MKFMIITGGLVLLAAIAAGGYWYISTNDSDTLAATTQNTKPQVAKQSQPTNQQSTLSVNDSPNESFDSSPPAPQLPQPESFSVYDQYATEESTLFIDTVIGQGEEAAAGDTVAMLYQGWLTDGTLFDASRPDETGALQPFIFTLGSGQVIRGWDQGINGMKTGGKRRLIIPSALGYGPTGQGTIPPDAMLIFDVELLAIQAAQ